MRPPDPQLKKMGLQPDCTCADAGPDKHNFLTNYSITSFAFAVYLCFRNPLKLSPPTKNLESATLGTVPTLRVLSKNPPTTLVNDQSAVEGLLAIPRNSAFLQSPMVGRSKPGTSFPTAQRFDCTHRSRMESQFLLLRATTGPTSSSNWPSRSICHRQLPKIANKIFLAREDKPMDLSNPSN